MKKTFKFNCHLFAQSKLGILKHTLIISMINATKVQEILTAQYSETNLQNTQLKRMTNIQQTRYRA